MTVGELITNIVKMLEENRINITDEVQVDIKHNNNIISGDAHKLLVKVDFRKELTKLIIRN